jgi:aminomethyltransferase
MQHSPLADLHRASGAKFMEFGGWDMPLHYGSQLDEHHAVRRHAGMFDVSHMANVDVTGPGALPFLRRVLANDVARIADGGQAQYGCMLNEQAGIIDDLIAYRFAPDRFRLVLNAGRRAVDLAWLRQQSAGCDVAITERAELAMISVQGPEARRLAAPLLGLPLAAAATALANFHATQQGDTLVARTGYTGEDGFEVALPVPAARVLWQGLVAAGVQPCGLGARDTLRLEAGLALHGGDIDENTHPLESRLAWTVAFEPADRDFIGRGPLERVRRDGTKRQLVGLLLIGPGVLRSHQAVFSGDNRVGETTSGSFAPTLARSVALARVTEGLTGTVTVDIRGQRREARIVTPPFVRHGRARIDLGN